MRKSGDERIKLHEDVLFLTGETVWGSGEGCFKMEFSPNSVVGKYNIWDIVFKNWPKFVEYNLWKFEVDTIHSRPYQLAFLKAVFRKFYLGHSWILWPSSHLITASFTVLKTRNSFYFTRNILKLFSIPLFQLNIKKKFQANFLQSIHWVTVTELFVAGSQWLINFNCQPDINNKMSACLMKSFLRECNFWLH